MGLPLAPEQAFEMQRKFIQAFAGHEFKKELVKLVAQGVPFEDARTRVVRNVQYSILPEHGFPLTPEGVSQMTAEIAACLSDPFIAHNAKELNNLLGVEFSRKEISNFAPNTSEHVLYPPRL